MTAVGRTRKSVLEIARRTKNLLFDFDMSLINISGGAALGLQRFSWGFPS